MLSARVLVPLGIAFCLLPACDKAVEQALDRCVDGDIQSCSCGEHRGEHTCNDGKYGECDCSQAERDAAQVEAGMKEADEVFERLEELEKERKALDESLRFRAARGSRSDRRDDPAAAERLAPPPSSAPYLPLPAAWPRCRRPSSPTLPSYEKPAAECGADHAPRAKNSRKRD